MEARRRRHNRACSTAQWAVPTESEPAAHRPQPLGSLFRHRDMVEADRCARIIGSKTTCLQAQAEKVPARALPHGRTGGEAIPLADGVTMRVVRWNHSGDPAGEPGAAQSRRAESRTGARIRQPADCGPALPRIFRTAAAIARISSPSTARMGGSAGSSTTRRAPVDLHLPIVIDGVDYGAPIENLQDGDARRRS